MSPTRTRSRSHLTSIARIEITPLMDLTFLLLIVFMITAPVLEFAVDVRPPELDAAPLKCDTHTIINLTRDGRLLIDDVVVTRESLGASVDRIFNADPETQFFVRADESRSYGEVIGIMRTVKAVGVTNIHLVTLAEGVIRR